MCLDLPSFRKALLAVIISFVLLSLPLIGQDTEDAYAKKYEKNYQELILKTHINGRYIPIDMYDALTQLDVVLDAEVQEFAMTLQDTVAGRVLTNYIGPWIIKNWNLYEGSRIAHYMKTRMQIYHPIDMTYVILQLYFRWKNGIPSQEDDLLTYVRERRAEIFTKEKVDSVINLDK